MNLIKITDTADKNSTLIFANLNGKLSPLGYILCESSTEWAAYDAAGNFINWFGSKKQALAAIA